MDGEWTWTYHTIWTSECIFIPPKTSWCSSNFCWYEEESSCLGPQPPPWLSPPNWCRRKSILSSSLSVNTGGVISRYWGNAAKCFRDTMKRAKPLKLYASLPTPSSTKRYLLNYFHYFTLLKFYCNEWLLQFRSLSKVEARVRYISRCSRNCELK